MRNSLVCNSSIKVRGLAERGCSGTHWWIESNSKSMFQICRMSCSVTRHDWSVKKIDIYVGEKKELFPLNYWLHFLKFVTGTNPHVARVPRCFPQSCGMLRCNENSVNLTLTAEKLSSNSSRGSTFIFFLLYCVQIDCGAHPTSQWVPGLKGLGRSAKHLALHLLNSYRTRKAILPLSLTSSWSRVWSRDSMLSVTLVSQILATTILFLVLKGACYFVPGSGRFFYISDSGLDVT